MTVQLQFLCHQPDTSESPVIVITNKTSKSSTRFSIYPHKIASFPKNGNLQLQSFSVYYFLNIRGTMIKVCIIPFKRKLNFLFIKKFIKPRKPLNNFSSYGCHHIFFLMNGKRS